MSELHSHCSIALFDSETDDVITGLEQFTGNLKLSENKQEEKDSESGTDLISTQPQNELSPSAHCAPHFAPLYISVIEADPRQNSAQLTKHEKKLLSEYQQQEGVQVLDLFDTEGVKGWTGETYESASVKYGDKAFHKFNKHLQAYPQQCLRYDSIKPAFYSLPFWLFCTILRTLPPIISVQ